MIERIEWIEAFIAVAEKKSFSIAARKLHKSQSRISVYISSLEKSLGHKLVDRRTIPIRLTAEGEIFLPYAREVIRILSRGEHELNMLDQGLVGHLTIGAIPSASSMFLPTALARFAKEYPHISVDVVERTTGNIFEHLLDGSLDLALVADSSPFTSTPPGSLPLWGEPIVAVFPEGHYLDNGHREIDAEELRGFLIGATGASGVGIDPDFALRLDHWGISTEGFPYRTEQPQTLLNMTKRGMMVSVINVLALLSCDYSGLKHRVINGDYLARKVGVAWNHAQDFSPLKQAMLNTIKETERPEATVAL